MKVIKMLEAGLYPALYGFGLSYRKKTDIGNWITKDGKMERIRKAAIANASRDGGHNKLLEHIMVWASVTATLEWWKQFDTYRAGVSKQSESTMHTLDSCDILSIHLDIKAEEFRSSNDHQIYLDYLNMVSCQGSRLKSKALPQGYTQEREVMLSYKVIRHCIGQRHSHKLPDWQSFINQLVDSLDTPEFLGSDILNLLAAGEKET
jgi:hypothetical protein